MITILVAVKAVPLGSAPVGLTPSGRWSDAGQWQLDPINQTTLEWAATRRRAGEAERIIAVSVGAPTSTVVALRAAQARGADELIGVDSDEQLDVRSTARVLARVARDVGAAIAAFGYESYDGSSGTLPAATAAELGWTVATRVQDASIVDGALRGGRSLPTGIASVTAPLPVVASFVEGVIVPGNPSLVASMSARRATPGTLDASALVDGEPLRAWTAGLDGVESVPPSGRDGVTLPLDEGVGAILALVRDVAVKPSAGVKSR